MGPQHSNLSHKAQMYAMVMGVVMAGVCVGTVSPAVAHETQPHTHQQLVPIPDYAPRNGFATGEAAFRTAQQFLSSLSTEAKSQMIFPWMADERTQWSNLPGGFFTRPGLSIGEMSDAQRHDLFAFLSASLGQDGYERLSEVLSAEAFLSQAPRAARNGWFPENYWISFYGTPSETGEWGWSFGGHHLALNISIRNGQVFTMSPTFVGTEPAVYRLNGVDHEAIVDMHRAGYATFQALTQDQQHHADAGRIPRDVQAGPGDDGYIPRRIGLAVSEMSAPQQELLLNTIRMWVSIQPDENAVPRMREIASQLDQTHFAWRGNDQVNTPTYMRIQGPSLIIELLSTGGNVGRNAKGLGHYHTIYRNPNTEYGR